MTGAPPRPRSTSASISSTSSSGRRRRRPAVAAAAASAPPPGDGENKTETKNKDPQRDSWDEEDDQDDSLRAQAEAEAAVERLLEPAWRGLKEAAQRELAASAAAARADGDADAQQKAALEAERLSRMSLSDALEGDRLLRTLAESELGPVLESMGLPRARALDFLYELVRTAALVQLATAAAVFYGAELAFGLDSGAAWRCVCGLGVGYVARLAVPVEALAWPLYDWLVRAATGGRGYYQPAARGGGGLGEGEEEGGARRGAGGREEAEGGASSSSSSSSAKDAPSPPSPGAPPLQRDEQARAALTRLGALFAACALAPPLFFGWAQEESALQFALPALGGALAFDAAYLAALVLKLREVEENGRD